MPLTDEGIVFEVDKRELITYSSLVHNINNLNKTLSDIETRFDTATAQILIYMKTIEDLENEVAILRAALTATVQAWDAEHPRPEE